MGPTDPHPCELPSKSKSTVAAAVGVSAATATTATPVQNHFLIIPSSCERELWREPSTRLLSGYPPVTPREEIGGHVRSLETIGHHRRIVMPNSYVHNPELNLTGQCMNDWQTGASNVLLKVLIRHVFGFQPGFDGLRVAPARWMPFASFQFDAVAHGRPVRISYTRQPVRLRQFRLAGQPFARTEHDRRLDTATVLMPYDALSDTAENVIEVIDPAAG